MSAKVPTSAIVQRIPAARGARLAGADRPGRGGGGGGGMPVQLCSNVAAAQRGFCEVSSRGDDDEFVRASAPASAVAPADEEWELRP